MASGTISHTQAIAKGVLASQILSVPFSSAFSSMAVMLAARFLSKTSARHRAQLRCNSRLSRIRMAFARCGAALVATVCVAMTIMELTIVYQTAVLNGDDVQFLTRIPWTSSLVPLLTSIVSIATQTYFSHKIYMSVERPRLVMPFLVILSIGSLVTGAAATLAMFFQPYQTSALGGITLSEALFWAYLFMTTFSSFFIMWPLIGSYLQQRRVLKMAARRAPNVKTGPTLMTSTLRFFLSTYTLVFIFDSMCLVTSIVSASSNFDVALHASEGFLVLQKLMVRIMALSYLYAMLDALPKRTDSSSPNDSEVTVEYGNGLERGFKTPLPDYHPNQNSKFKLRDIQTSVSAALSRYESDKHRSLSSEDDEGEEIFAYSYPPNSGNPIGTASQQPVIAGSEWAPVGYGPGKTPPATKKPTFNFPPVPRRSSPPSFNKAKILPPIPNRLHPSESMPGLPGSKKTKRSPEKAKRQLSQIKYINSPVLDGLMGAAQEGHPT